MSFAKLARVGIVAGLSLGLAVAAVSAPVMESKTVKADQAFPLLKGFLNLPVAQRDQIALGYALKVKDADASLVKITLNHNGRSTEIRVGADGRLAPLPTRDQLNANATVTINGPKAAKVSMKLKTYATQIPSRAMDAAALARGIDQGNNAVKKIAGLMAAGVPKLDRVYFVGGGQATLVTTSGARVALPKTTGGEYGTGTPYYVPSQMAGGARIELAAVPRSVMYDTK